MMSAVKMVSRHETHTNSNGFPLQRNYCSLASSASTRNKLHRNVGRSMRTIRSNFFRHDQSCSFTSDTGNSGFVSENLTESVIDMRLGELASKTNPSLKYSSKHEEFLDISQAFSDFSACSSDISGELQRLANLPMPDDVQNSNGEAREVDADREPEPCLGFLQRENFSTEIIESISPEDLQPTVKICMDGLQSSSVAVKRSAAAKIRLLAKNRADNRALIGESGVIPALIPLLRCSDPWTQEHAVTALLNLSLHEGNKALITHAGAIKSLVYVLKTGTDTSKENAACALLSLSLVEENKSSIGACGAISPLVALLLSGSSRGKKDALTTLYKLCSIKNNKERAVSAGAVKPLVSLVVEQGTGLAEKAMVVLNSLAGIEQGKEAIVEEGGIATLVFLVPCCFGLSKDSTDVSEEEMYTTIPEEFCQRFSVSELRKATNNLDQSLDLAWGVYKGHIIMNGTNKLVVVYNNQIQSPRHSFSFKTEIQFLCQLHHPNILSLVGYCIHKKGQMLVVDYMPNLSLDRHLRAYGAGITTTEPLSWRRRLEICIGAARGLHYLHTGAKYAIIHRDVSSRTILLDDNWVPKLSAFGLSKRGPLSLSKKLIRLDSVVRGRGTYVAPEYAIHGELTEKTDVFLFGMVLLEVVSAKMPNHQLRLRDRNKMQTVFDCVRQDDNIADILDPFLVGKIGSECLKRYMSIAERCLDYEKSNRPAMGEVEVELEHALQLQQSADGFYDDANCDGEMPI